MSAQPTLEEFRKRCRAWLEANAEPRAVAENRTGEPESDSVALFHNRSLEEEAALLARIRAWYQAKAAAGLASITWETEYGGLNLPIEYERVMRKEEALFRTPPSHELIGVSTNLVAATIRAHGTAQQRATFVAALRSTALVACQMFSEPGAGSDLSSLSTHAERDDDGGAWIISGQKVWTSGAQFADYGLTLCRTDPDAPDPREGITAFLIPMNAAGVTVRPLRQMTGGSSFNEVFFDSVRVHDDHRIGEVGAGWRVGRTTLAFERAASASAPRIGASWEHVRALAQKMGAMGDPVVRQQLAQLYCLVRALRWSGARGLARARAGHSPGPEGSIAKLAWAQQLQLISDAVSHILGPRLIADTNEWATFAWAEHVTGAPGYRIAGGTDEIQRNIIGERVLGLPPEPKHPRVSGGANSESRDECDPVRG